MSNLFSFLLSLLIFQGFLALTSSQLLTLLTENPTLLLIHPLLTLWFSLRYDQVASHFLTSSRTLLPLGLGMCSFSLGSSSIMYLNSSAPHLILGACSENSFFGEASSNRVFRIAPLPIALAAAAWCFNAHSFILLLSAPLEYNLFHCVCLTAWYSVWYRDSEITVWMTRKVIWPWQTS